MKIMGCLSKLEIQLDIDTIGKLVDYYVRLSPPQIRNYDFMERCVEMVKDLRKLQNGEREAVQGVIESRVKEEISTIDGARTTIPEDTSMVEDGWETV